MEPAPNSFLTYHVIFNVWTMAQAERYITAYGPYQWRVGQAELRTALGRGVFPAAVYRFRLSLVAISLYVSGHQSTPRDIIHCVETEGLFPLQPIQAGLRWWTPSELLIVNALL